MTSSQQQADRQEEFAETAPPPTNDSYRDPKESLAETAKEQKQEPFVGVQLEFRKDSLNIARTVNGAVVAFDKRNMYYHF